MEELDETKNNKLIFGIITIAIILICFNIITVFVH